MLGELGLRQVLLLESGMVSANADTIPLLFNANESDTKQWANSLG